ncbi:Uncharacterized conserved protein [Janthinobacterium sp. Marseille]|uniref:ATP-binding protein n=1 Tax=Herminiimonas aquatilis TaxID=345342 RepID=A0ABW2J6X3_9BURK|nr:hypothetical protein [Janthinobacterium sp. Marseille]ABR91875.1 Uncharacterized conserved protein [Janthinobacterium sp. Marseille]MBX9798569.1 hypothetical protein [Burkholderiaceae bacterium]
MKDIRLAYAQNRAEEQPKDIWEEFVIPLYFNDLPIKEQRKSLVFQGGRGCGKTMLLRYLSHTSQFSPRRLDLSLEDVKYVGLYLRADTNYLAAMNGGGVQEEIWQRAFSHWLACSLSLELIDAVYSINCTEVRQKQFGNLQALNFSAIAKVYPHLGTTFSELKASLILERSKLTAWINNLDSYTRPIFLPGKEFIKDVIDVLQSTLDYLKDSVIATFIDEYENLIPYQQKIINELIKHGQSPLIFNVAIKRNGMTNPGTRGPESIQDIGDLRLIDIEDHLSSNFDLFAAELLFFRLAETAPELLSTMPISIGQLRDPAEVVVRLNDVEYRKSLLNAANTVFPRLRERELAQEVMADASLREHLSQNIRQGLNAWKSALPAAAFISADAPEVSLVSGAILNRKSVTPDELLKELQNYCERKTNRFESAEWIKNNLVGVILQLYSKVNRPCPFFAGFDAFVLMSRGNVRHFLELLHQSFLRAKANGSEIPVLSAPDQAEAVRAASSEFLNGVRSSGIHGNRLHGLTLSLGAIFKEKQRHVAQSETEINHFSISEGDLTEKLIEYLSEAVKWSVLYEDPETKKKNVGVSTLQYILNPIFSGYFQISYRKKKSIQIAAPDLLGLLEDEVKQKDAIVRRIAREKIDNPTLPLDF